MTKYNTFNNTNSKSNKLWDNIQTNKQNTEDLESIKIIEVPLSTLKKTSRFPLDTNPIYYDLYDFKGITYRGGGGYPPSPENCYHEDPPNHWHFILPIFDYRVPAGENPEDITGCPDWEFQSSIGNIRQILRFTSLSEEDIYSFDILSYLYDKENSGVEGENFSQFSRWVKNSNGYDFYYHAFFTIPQDKQLFLKAELVLLNKRDYNAIQYRKIQN